MTDVSARAWSLRYKENPRCGVPGCTVTDPDQLGLYLAGLRCAEHNVPITQPYGEYKPNRFTPRGTKKGSRNKKDVHGHGCLMCKATFFDACYEPDVNHICSFCETGRGWERERDFRAPRECCRGEGCRLARKEEVASYGLAGDKPWWICTTCKRTFIYKPKGVT